MTEPEMSHELTELKTVVFGVKDKVGELDTEIRVTKHEVNNLKQMLSGFTLRLDKCEERLTSKIEALGDRLSALNVKHERGVGYVMGVAGAVTGAGTILLVVAKMLGVGQ